MTWADWADDLAMACRDTFGEPVTLRRLDPETGTLGDPVAITAPFDRSPQPVDAGNSVPVSSTRPRLSVRLADLPWPPEQGDVVTVRDADWTVVDVESDGHGSARLHVHEG